MKDIYRAGCIALLIFAAVLIAVLVPSPWDDAGGRDFRPQGLDLAFILFIGATAIRSASRWSLISLVGGLFLVEILALFIIGSFSGLTGTDLFDSFNLEWLAYVSLFVGAPWLAGIAVGSSLLWARTRTVGDA